MINILILPFPTVRSFSNEAIVCWDCLPHSFSLSPSKYSMPILADLWKGGKEEEWRRKRGNKGEQRRRGEKRGEEEEGEGLKSLAKSYPLPMSLPCSLLPTL